MKRHRWSVVLALAVGGCTPSSTRPAATPGTLRFLIDNGGRPGGAVRFVPTPLVRQSRDFTCGAAALQSVLLYWGEEFREGQLQRALESDPDRGTSYRAMERLVLDLNDASKARALHSLPASDESDRSPDGFEVPGQLQSGPSRSAFSVLTKEGKSPRTRPLSETGSEVVPLDGVSSRELESFIESGRPPIVLLQAWASTPSVDWANDWEDGHYAVAVGYDRENFYFMDPSTAGNYTRIPRQELGRRWHDVDVRAENGKEVKTNLNRFAMVISRGVPAFDLTAIVKME